jgi:hypothetical protein
MDSIWTPYAVKFVLLKTHFGQKLIKNIHSVSTESSPYGLYMDSIWTLYVLYMYSVWTLYGLYMDSKWTLYGLYLDSICALYELHMDSIWRGLSATRVDISVRNVSFVEQF